jgi:Protein of unknown function (DUF1614)/Outer membrane efflux protein
MLCYWLGTSSVGHEAEADLYPKLSLTGSIGLESLQLADLPKGASRFWAIGPTLSWPIFDAGRIRANIAVQDARTDQQFSTYRQTVLTALQDVENALVAYSREQTRRTQLVEAVEANRRAVGLATDLYRVGLGTFLNVLDAQRSLLASQSDLAQSETTVSTDVVHWLAYPVKGMGIAVPVFIPPVVAAVTALLLSRQSTPPLAYISGSLGTLIGADLLNLGQIQALGEPVASIGGAGRFGGIFMTGVLAVLLAGVAGVKPAAR